MIRPAAVFSRHRLFCNFNKHFGATAFLFIAAIILPVSVSAQDPKPAEPPPAQTPALSLEEELAKLRKQVAQLSGEVSRLRAELAKLERYKTIDYTRELMLKEEQRVRELQKELVDNAAKETALQKRLDEIEEEQRPDRIERSLAGVGSVRPEEEREAISRRLANEKRRIQAQLETLRLSRTRIPPLIVNAEESIARLRQRLIELRTIH
jgi:voltage-gated potassium channel Kch